MHEISLYTLSAASDFSGSGMSEAKEKKNNIHNIEGGKDMSDPLLSFIIERWCY